MKLLWILGGLFGAAAVAKVVGGKSTSGSGDVWLPPLNERVASSTSAIVSDVDTDVYQRIAAAGWKPVGATTVKGQIGDIVLPVYKRGTVCAVIGMGGSNNAEVVRVNLPCSAADLPSQSPAGPSPGAAGSPTPSPSATGPDPFFAPAAIPAGTGFPPPSTLFAPAVVPGAAPLFAPAIVPAPTSPMNPIFPAGGSAPSPAAQLQAFLAAIRPASQATLSPEDADAMVEEYASRGLIPAAFDASLYTGPEAYVAGQLAELHRVDELAGLFPAYGGFIRAFGKASLRHALSPMVSGLAYKLSWGPGSLGRGSYDVADRSDMVAAVAALEYNATMTSMKAAVAPYSTHKAYAARHADYSLEGPYGGSTKASVSYWFEGAIRLAEMWSACVGSVSAK